MPNNAFYSALARSILAGEPTAEAVAARMRRTLGENWRWIGNLAGRYARVFGGKTRPRLRDVIEFLRADDGLIYAKYKYRDKLRIAEWVTERARMQPVYAARTWAVPRIESVGELAAWLNSCKSFFTATGLGQSPRSQNIVPRFVLHELFTPSRLAKL